MKHVTCTVDQFMIVPFKKLAEPRIILNKLAETKTLYIKLADLKNTWWHTWLQESKSWQRKRKKTEKTGYEEQTSDFVSN